jgi:hypothetical protein
MGSRYHKNCCCEAFFLFLAIGVVGGGGGGGGNFGSLGLLNVGIIMLVKASPAVLSM